MNRSVATVEDALRLLDEVFLPAADRWTARGASWWDSFYGDRERPVPFFTDAPDENLVQWWQDGRLGLPDGARVLELGCGPGRNAVWLAQRGYRVDAVDLAPSALRWGVERAAAAGVDVTFVQADVLQWHQGEGEQPYDLVLDSGCFHHLPPHRRLSYRALLGRTLAPGGAFALCCFAAGAGAMGSELPDTELYRLGSLQGGLAYSDDELRGIFGGLQEVELRRMRTGGELFGEDFLSVALFRRTA